MEVHHDHDHDHNHDYHDYDDDDYWKKKLFSGTWIEDKQHLIHGWIL